MGLTRLLLAWILVAAWLVLWEAAGRVLARGGTGSWLRAPLWRYGGEAALLVLLGALWFTSLGAGAWWLVFALVGALVEWRASGETRRSRGRPPRALVGRALGVARVVVAGGLLAWRLGPA